MAPNNEWGSTSNHHVAPLVLSTDEEVKRKRPSNSDRSMRNGAFLCCRCYQGLFFLSSNPGLFESNFFVKMPRKRKVTDLSNILEAHIRTKGDIPATGFLCKACKFDNERYISVQKQVREDLGPDMSSIIMFYYGNPLPILVPDSNSKKFLIRCKDFTLCLIRFTKENADTTILLRDFLAEGMTFWDDFLKEISLCGLMIDGERDLSHRHLVLTDDGVPAPLRQRHVLLSFYQEAFHLENFSRFGRDATCARTLKFINT